MTFERRRACRLWLAGAALLTTALAGCVGTSPDPAPMPHDDDGWPSPGDPEPETQDPTGLQELRAFTDACMAAADVERPGVVDYPESVDAVMDRSSVYYAAVDVRSLAPPPEQVIETDDPGQQGVIVGCTLAAKLSAAGDAVIEDADWVYRKFGPTGVLEWTWEITPTTPKDEDLVLEIRPAVLIQESGSQDGTLTPAGLGVGVTSTVTLVSELDVSASLLQRLAYWIEVNTGSATLIGITVVGVLGFLATRLLPNLKKLAEALRTFRKPATDDPSDGAPTPSGDHGQTPRARTDRTPHRTAAGR